MMKMKLILPALLLIAAYTALSCQAGPPELEQPDIRGTVDGLSDSRSNSDIAGFILIEGVPGDDTNYDRAFVTVTADTRIYQHDQERLVKARYKEIEHGSLLEVWFTGPVAESYPVQAEADIIVILE